MKTSVVLSAAIVALLKTRNVNPQAVIQACEAYQNSRREVARESLGTRNRKKTGVAESGETVKFEAESNTVSRFIEYAEKDAGTFDRLAARAARLGATVQAVDYPSAEIADWLGKPGFRAEKPASKSAEKPAKIAA